MDIGHDEQFHRRDWTVERFAWALMLLAIFAALAGLFGTGPLSKATAGEENGALQVEYQRFWRVQKPMPLRVSFRPPKAAAGEAAVWLDAGYLRELRVERVDPQPLRTELGADRIAYVFAVSGTEPVEAVFHLKADKAGRHAGSIGIEGVGVALSHFLYP